MSEQTFTPAPLVPDRRLRRTGESGPNTPERIRYTYDVIRAAGISTRQGMPSDDTLLQAYERLARRGNGEERRDG